MKYSSLLNVFFKLCNHLRPLSCTALRSQLSLDTFVAKTQSNRLTGRDFAYDKIIEAGRWSTQLNKYIALLNSTQDPLHPYSITYNQFYPVTSLQLFTDKLRACPTNQLPKVIIDWYVWRTNNNDPDMLATVISALDDECQSRANDLDHTEMLNLLYAFLYVAPNKLVRLNFYDNAVHRLAKTFRSEQCRSQFVQICFYLGLRKRNTDSTVLLQTLLQRHFNKFLDKMTILDAAIVTTASFRSSTKMQINHAMFVESQLLRLDGTNDSLLISFVKTIRLNGCRSPTKIHNHLRELLLSGRLSHFQFRGIIHVFAFFADNLIMDTNATKYFIDDCLQKVQTNYQLYKDGNAVDLPNDMRAKDFGMFLWCLAQLNLGEHVCRNDLNMIERILVDKADAGEYNRNFDGLVDVTLSLWMLGHHSKPLLCELIYNQNVPSEAKHRVRLDSRKNLLFSCIEIEEPDWFLEFRLENRSAFQPEYPAQDYLLEKTPNLKHIFKLLEAKHDVKLVKSIRDLNIPGILMKLKGGSSMLIDVLEDTTILSDGQTPFGLLALKRTLLRASGCDTTLVRFTVTYDMFPFLMRKHIVF